MDYRSRPFFSPSADRPSRSDLENSPNVPDNSSETPTEIISARDGSSGGIGGKTAAGIDRYVDEKWRQIHSEQTLSAYSRIAEISLYFERTWSSERVFSMEDALALVPEKNRDELFERLLEIDLSLGVERNALISPDDYKKRFPQWADQIDRISAEVMSQSVVVHKMRVGRSIGNYVIQEIIGKGGMGIVYKALDRPFHREVAIKYLLPNGNRREECFELFKSEIALMGQLPPGSAFAQAYSCDRDGDFYYLAMEFIDGIDLARYVKSKTKSRSRSGPLDWWEAADYIRQVAAGLDTIHQRGIVHRDIKPENIMLDGTGRIRILDLGLGLFQGNATVSDRTVSGEKTKSEPAAHLSPEKRSPSSFMGTPAYASPEGCHSPESIDARSDLYSLGGTFFYLLTGRLPIEWFNPMGTPPSETLREFFHRKQIPIRADILAVLSSLMEPDPASRCPGAAEAVRRLDAILERHSPDARRKRQRRIRCASFVLIFVAVLTTVFTFYKQHAEAERLYREADRLYHEGMLSESNGHFVNIDPSKLPSQTRPDYDLLKVRLAHKLEKENRDKLRHELSEFLKAIPEENRDSECWAECARINKTLEEYHPAKRAVCQAIKLSPHDDALWCLDGEISVLLGDTEDQKKRDEYYRDATAIFQEIIAGRNPMPEALYWQARAYHGQAKNEFALDDLDQAVKILASDGLDRVIEEKEKSASKGPDSAAKQKFALLKACYQLRGEIRWNMATSSKSQTDPEWAKKMACATAADYSCIAKMSEKEERSDARLMTIKAYDAAEMWKECLRECQVCLEETPMAVEALLYRGKARYLSLEHTGVTEDNRSEWEKVLTDLIEWVRFRGKETDPILPDELRQPLKMLSNTALRLNRDPIEFIGDICGNDSNHFLKNQEIIRQELCEVSFEMIQPKKTIESAEDSSSTEPSFPSEGGEGAGSEQNAIFSEIQ